MTDTKNIYPRTGDRQTIYLGNVITSPYIEVGDYTMYHDFVNDRKILLHCLRSKIPF